MSCYENGKLMMMTACYKNGNDNDKSDNNDKLLRGYNYFC